MTIRNQQYENIAKIASVINYNRIRVNYKRGSGDYFGIIFDHGEEIWDEDGPRIEQINVQHEIDGDGRNSSPASVCEKLNCTTESFRNFILE